MIARGQVYLQSYMTENNVMQSLADQGRDAFSAVELESRQFADMPPFSRLAGVILSGKNEKSVEALGRTLVQTAPRSDDFTVMGPAVTCISRCYADDTGDVCLFSLHAR